MNDEEEFMVNFVIVSVELLSPYYGGKEVLIVRIKAVHIWGINPFLASTLATPVLLSCQPAVKAGRNMVVFCVGFRYQLQLQEHRF